MSRKAKAKKISEACVVSDSLARLGKRLDLKGLPFSEEELQTLARRFRESFFGTPKRKERLARYQAHLAKKYEPDLVTKISAELESINNEIGWEEK